MKVPFAKAFVLSMIIMAGFSCGGGRNVGPDGGGPAVDGSVADDAGVVADTGVPDAGPQDAGPVYPACGSHQYAWRGLIAGPGDPGFDENLDKKARAYDRCWTIFNAAPFGLNADGAVKKSKPENRDLITRFISETDAWDFKAFSGKEPAEVMDGWGDSVGMYGGAGAAADAFRYAVLRDRGEECDEVGRARAQLTRILEPLHIATDITGVPGVIARAIIRKDLPGNDAREPTPLFDEQGNPLPAEKNNGTLRADNSGNYPGWMWNDSCSRDMLVGWAQAYAAVWEAIADDPSFDLALKDRLREDARQIGLSLSKVRESGYDLEIRDADGRMTYHGVMNENSIDRNYVKDAANGFYAIMALGIVSAFAFVSGDAELDEYVKKQLIRKRKLDVLARDSMQWVNMGEFSNFSNYNMAFTGGWLALRYTPDADARAVVAEAVKNALYEVPGYDRQPVEMKQTWFDVVFAYSFTGSSVFGPAAAAPDEAAIARGLETLSGFKTPPFWDDPVLNCDEDEIASGSCTLNDGTPVTLLGNVGWGDQLVADKPIPMRVRKTSNYYWRSNPYEPNGEGGGESLLPGVDFRVAYWTGRWAKR